jgi:predicted CopG family antitoxin
MSSFLSRFLCFNKIDKENVVEELDETNHHLSNIKDGINSHMDIIKQKIDNKGILNNIELRYISNLNKRELIDIIDLYNEKNKYF